MKIIVILCEGQTEEIFAQTILKPYFSTLGIVLKTHLLTTNRKLKCTGGIISYTQVKGDLQRLFKMYQDNDFEEYWFTTMLDYYALPDSFPAQNQIFALAADKVSALEQAFGEELDYFKFIPYIQLHEFESLVFAGLDFLEEEYEDCHKEIAGLKKTLHDCQGNPERVNNSKETAPSKRIINALKGKHNYNKTHVGPKIAGKVGLVQLRIMCKHFDYWISKLESIV